MFNQFSADLCYEYLKVPVISQG